LTSCTLAIRIIISNYLDEAIGFIFIFTNMDQPTAYSDKVLLEKINNSDKEAFAQFYRKYWEQLFTTAAKTLRSKEEAADLVQDIFVSLWNRRGSLQIEGPAAAYLLQSVKYKSIHYIEKNITRRDYLAVFSDMVAHNIAPSAEVDIDLKQVKQIVNQAVEAMPARMQEVYRLSREEHLSHKEIGARMGISTETVKKHIQHALQLIKQALGHLAAFIILC
jgi:RNA polymerase sigma-70 factor (ECF subfamily)